MNPKNLTLSTLKISEELKFIQNYHKYLLDYCIENEIPIDGDIGIKIIEFIEKIQDLLDNPERVLSDDEVQLLIRLAEGRIFLETTELSIEYNKDNTHDILRIPRYKIYHVLESHGY